MSVLIFLLVLFVLVLVHEWGHFIVAKKTGMRVDEFGIGFPPKLFGIKRGETEYTFNLLPIGGFVKIYGEDADAAESADDYRRSFVGKNKWAQSAVLIAGVTMNVLFAWFLFSIAYMSGVQETVPEGAAGESARLVITNVLEDGPAADADIPRGAIVTTLKTESGVTLNQVAPSSFSGFIAEYGAEKIEITYTFGGDRVTSVLEPKAGIIPTEPDRMAVGVALALVDTVQYSVPSAIREGFMSTIFGLRDITVGLFTLVRDAVVGEADLSQVAGPVGIVGLVGEASAFGVTALLMFTAFISLNLAVINLLPFPALDGGRLLFVIIEAVKGSPIRPQYAQTLNTVGFMLLILLMVIVTWNDISRLI
jgi:regulator of sigma E protease